LIVVVLSRESFDWKRVVVSSSGSSSSVAFAKVTCVRFVLVLVLVRVLLFCVFSLWSFPCIAMILVLRWVYGACLCCGAFSMLRFFFHVAVLFPCCLTGFFHVAMPLVMLRCL
jgi:hypothetical protein